MLPYYHSALPNLAFSLWRDCIERVVYQGKTTTRVAVVESQFAVFGTRWRSISDSVIKPESMMGHICVAGAYSTLKNKSACWEASAQLAQRPRLWLYMSNRNFAWVVSNVEFKDDLTSEIEYTAEAPV